MERGLLGGIGVAMALFGGMFSAIYVGDLFSTPRKYELGIDIGLIVFFGGMTLAGIYMAWQMYRTQPAATGAARPGTVGQAAGRQGRRQREQDGSPVPPASPAERERRVLQYAEREHGRVTVPEVAANCGMTIAEAKLELDRLAASGAADLRVTEHGVLVYVFAGFLSDEEKSRASDF
jgi:hypothetical protein